MTIGGALKYTVVKEEATTDLPSSQASDVSLQLKQSHNAQAIDPHYLNPLSTGAARDLTAHQVDSWRQQRQLSNIQVASLSFIRRSHRRDAAAYSSWVCYIVGVSGVAYLLDKAWLLLLLGLGFVGIFRLGNSAGYLVPGQAALQSPPSAVSRWCDVCHIYQPLRTRHCRECGVCVATFDHHCFWLGGCVGEKNHLSFCVLMYFLSGCFAVVVDSVWSQMTPAKGTGLLSWLEDQGGIILLLMTAWAPLLLVGSLAGYHTYLLATGQTTWEQFSRERISYMRVARKKRPFSRGILGNIGEVWTRKGCDGVREWRVGDDSTTLEGVGLTSADNHERTFDTGDDEFDCCDNPYYSCC